jgi:hypothetical protein
MSCASSGYTTKLKQSILSFNICGFFPFSSKEIERCDNKRKMFVFSLSPFMAVMM